MSERGCTECDGQGYVFRHLDGDVLMENCPACGQVADRGPGFKGFWFSVGWTPNSESPPGSKEWKVTIIEENAGVVTLRPLEPAQLASVCSGGKTSLLWMSVISLTSELAREKARTDALQLRIGALERRGDLFGWIVAFFGRVFGRKEST